MKCAVYCRLSKEDEDKIDESESIQNQKSLLLQFALDKGWEIYKIYCDEDYSGIDRERPDFNALLQAAAAHKFDIVLCKTQSRFTRDMELVEKYIHYYFPLWGVRFVTAVDHVDTASKGNKKARQINGLVNEWYLEDLSENIQAVLDHKRQNGQYIGSFPLYGYIKDPADRHRLLIDEEAALVVRLIYRLYLEGNGFRAIANKLNAEKIPNPTLYKQQKGWQVRAAGNSGLWNDTTIRRILQNQMYVGTLVQGINRKVSYKSKKSRGMPPEAWFKLESCHEPIIDKASFEAVQALLQPQTRSNAAGQVQPLAGKVFCLDCGSIMQQNKKTYKGKAQYYLVCKQYRTGRQQALCSNHNIRLNDLIETVQRCLSLHIKQLPPEAFEAVLFQQSVECQSMIQKQLNRKKEQLESKISNYAKALKSLYLDQAAGVITTAKFQDMRREFLQEQQRFETQLTEVQKQLKKHTTQHQPGIKQYKGVAEWLQAEGITRDLIDRLVRKIEIGKKPAKGGMQTIKIHWNF